MTYTIRANDDGTFVVLTPARNIARVTNGEAFITRDRTLAEESVEFLNTNRGKSPFEKAVGSHRMKSIWGTI